ncbi:MAG: hypothetical protein EAS48_00285 [Chryseobacterium sp.]|nr:MAG: hypothetical protein EAS48_00285 [Chryseobacterium sp.]
MNRALRESRNFVAIVLVAVYFFALFSGIFHRHSVAANHQVSEIVKGKLQPQGDTSCLVCHFNSELFTASVRPFFDFAPQAVRQSLLPADIYRPCTIEVGTRQFSPRGPPVLNS